MEVIRIQSPRHWLRFSLSSLLIAMTLASIGLGWWRQRALAQKASREAIEKYGGWCFYDYQIVNKKATQKTTSRVPKWLLDNLGYDYFHSVVEVNLTYDDSRGGRQNNANLTDGALVHLDGLPQVKRLMLQKTQASDEGLRHVGQLPRLEDIYMWDATNVTDAGIAHLAKARRLRMVHCSNSQITDESLRILSSLPRMEDLSLQENRFTDQGLFYVKDMVQLKRLVLGLSPPGATERKPITDAGLVHLRRLTNLELLDLQHTQITPAGLQDVAGLKNLKDIWIARTAIRDPDLKQLHALLPNCSISADD